MSTKLSIIVPVYNVEKYIEKCLESLVKQTIDSYEIIVVIDGSPDNSIEIVKKYKNKYPNIIKYFETENRGLSAARNYGLKKAKGEYIGFVDSDDYIDIHMFERLYNHANINKCDIAICDYYKIIEEGQKSIELKIDEADTRKELILKSKAYSWNKIYKRSLFQKCNIEFPEGLIFEDICTIYPILMQAEKIGYINEKLYFYRFNRNDSIMKNKKRKDLDIIKILERLNSYSRQYNLFDKYNELLCELNVRHIYYRIREKTKCFNARIYKIKFIYNSFKFLNSNFPNWKTKSKYVSNIPNIKKNMYLWQLKTLVKG